MFSVLTLLTPEQRRRAVKQYNIPVRDIEGKVVSYRCFDGGDFWFEVFKDKTGNYEKNSLTIGDVLQLLNIPVEFDEYWNLRITPEVEPYYYDIGVIMDMNDAGKLRTWKQTRGLFS
jgi:hypothetical protein